MIKSLYIENYALLEKVMINFEGGFTCISGETGAGKSIILDALSLVLGKRADCLPALDISRKSTIEGIFVLKDFHKLFFENYDIDFEYETIIRREISPKGRSRTFINDTPVLLQTLSLFSKQILEMYSQGETIILKDEYSKFQLIDQLSNSQQYLANYRKDFLLLNELKKDLEVIKGQGSLSATELDFLEFQYKELNDANIYKGEKEDIEDKINLLENIDGISNAIYEGKDLLNNEQGVINYLQIIKRKLVESKSLPELEDRLESVIIELTDIDNEFSNIGESLNTNPEELLEINKRLDLINSLLQKHRLSFDEQLIKLKDDFHTRIELSSSFTVLLDEKLKLIDEKLKDLEVSASLLKINRLKILPKIKTEVESVLKKLGMPYAQFEIQILENKQYHINGNCSVLFNFSANRGNDMQELSKVASGGELSRLMLAIKHISAKNSNVQTLIFDEIDSGVSGEIASLMGEMMSEISSSNQLIAISHLPQIASRADTHLKVIKTTNKDKTTSSVVELDNESRIKEIAKLLSGKRLTQAAIDNAVELLNQ